MSLAGARRWSVRTPYTYVLQVVLEANGVQVDAENVTVAFRVSKWDANNGFFMDSTRVHLRGREPHQIWRQPDGNRADDKGNSSSGWGNVTFQQNKVVLRRPAQSQH